MPLCFEYGSASASTSSHREKTVLPHPIPILCFIRLPNWKARSNSTTAHASSIINSCLPILIEWRLRAKLWGLVLGERIIGCWHTITTVTVLGLIKGIHAWLLIWLLLLLLHKWIWSHAASSTGLLVLKWLAILYRERGCKSWRLLILTLSSRIVLEWVVVVRLILHTIKWRRLNLEHGLLLLRRLKWWNTCRILVTVRIHERRLERHRLILLHTHGLTIICCRCGGFKLKGWRICRGWTNVEWCVKSRRSGLLLCWTITCCRVTKWALRLNLRLV